MNRSEDNRMFGDLVQDAKHSLNKRDQMEPDHNRPGEADFRNSGVEDVVGKPKPKESKLEEKPTTETEDHSHEGGILSGLMDIVEGVSRYITSRGDEPISSSDEEETSETETRHEPSRQSSMKAEDYEKEQETLENESEANKNFFKGFQPEATKTKISRRKTKGRKAEELKLNSEVKTDNANVTPIITEIHEEPDHMSYAQVVAANIPAEDTHQHEDIQKKELTFEMNTVKENFGAEHPTVQHTYEKVQVVETLPRPVEDTPVSDPNNVYKLTLDESNDGANSAYELASQKGHEAAEKTKEAAEKTKEAAQSALEGVKETTTSAAQYVVDTTKSAASTVYDGAADMTHRAAEKVQEGTAAVVDTTKSTATAAYDGVADMTHRAADKVQEGTAAVVDTTKSTATAAYDGVADMGHRAVDTIYEGTAAVVDTTKSTATAAYDGVADMGHRAVDTIYEGTAAAIDTTKSTANATLEGAIDVGNKTAETIKEGTTAAIDTVKSVIEGAKDKASSATQYVVDTTGSAYQGAKDSTAAAIHYVADTTKAATDSVAQGATNVKEAIVGQTPATTANDHGEMMENFRNTSTVGGESYDKVMEMGLLAAGQTPGYNHPADTVVSVETTKTTLPAGKKLESVTTVSSKPADRAFANSNYEMTRSGAEATVDELTSALEEKQDAHRAVNDMVFEGGAADAGMQVVDSVDEELEILRRQLAAAEVEPQRFPTELYDEAAEAVKKERMEAKVGHLPLRKEEAVPPGGVIYDSAAHIGHRLADGAQMLVDGAKYLTGSLADGASQAWDTAEHSADSFHDSIPDVGGPIRTERTSVTKTTEKFVPVPCKLVVNEMNKSGRPEHFSEIH